MDRTLFRGDTLFFVDQVVQNPLTLERSSAPTGQLPAGFVPLDLTGAHVQFTAKLSPADTDNQAVFLLDNQALGGVAVTQAQSGKVSVTGPASATLGFADDPTVLFYDLQVVDSGGRVSTVESGTITVSPDASRATT